MCGRYLCRFKNSKVWSESFPAIPAGAELCAEFLILRCRPHISWKRRQKVSFVEKKELNRFFSDFPRRDKKKSKMLDSCLNLFSVPTPSPTVQPTFQPTFTPSFAPSTPDPTTRDPTVAPTPEVLFQEFNYKVYGGHSSCFADEKHRDEWAVDRYGLFWAWASPCSGDFKTNVFWTLVLNCYNLQRMCVPPPHSLSGAWVSCSAEVLLK